MRDECASTCAARSPLVSIFALAVGSLLIACNGSDTDPTPTNPPPSPVVVGSVILSPASFSVEATDTVRLTATVRSSTGQTLSDRSVSWISNSTAIATVGSSGLVSGIAPGGPVIITATADGVTGNAQITITAVAVAAISIAPSPTSLMVGAQRQLIATLRDARNNVLTGRTTTWTSSDPTKLSVTNGGLITGLALGGPITLTAASEGKQATLSVTVVPVPVARVTVSNPAGDLNEGGSVQLIAQTTDSAGSPLTGRPVVWTSDSAHIATVDAAGVVKTVRTGVARIRARAEGVDGLIDIPIHGLLHRWTFSEQGGAGTTFRDDVSSATAQIVNLGTTTASATATAGQVTLAGGAYAVANYVALPKNLLSKRTDVTIEVWATLHSLKNWSRILDIGTNGPNSLFIAWSQGLNSFSDRTAFAVAGVEERLDNRLAPFTIDLQHHVALSIDEGGGTGGKTRITAFLDGVSRGSFDTNYRLRDIEGADFWLGRSHYADETAHASYDEIRVHDRVYPATEVLQSYLRGPVRAGPSSIRILAPSGMRDTVRGLAVQFPLKAVGLDAAGRQFQIAGAKWTSSNSAVATVDSNGIVRTLTPGRSEFAATVGNVTAKWTADVVRLRRVAVDPYLATPAAGALWEVPVILIEYLPTADGTSIDTLKNPDFYYAGRMTLDSAERRVLTFAKRRKMGVEEGSRFRGYKDATALPSLGYRVVEHIIVYELEPPSERRDYRLIGAPRYPDWFQIFADLQLDPLMRTKRVKEIWIADSGLDGGIPSYNPAIHNVDDFRVNYESNMSSPTTGDISNSFREPDDLPVFSHTYVVYGINYRRTQAEALHVVGHQLEAMLSYVATRQTGSDRLFWRDFVGQNAQQQFITGRTGWTHMPPNTIGNYDYLNRTSVLSDIEDWKPDNSGVKKEVNVDTWGTLKYPWPGEADFDQRVESQWYTYWWQNFPGKGNRIPYNSTWMTNWWAFLGDWDAATNSGLGLYSATPAAIRGTSIAYPFSDPPIRAASPEARRPARPGPMKPPRK